MNGGVIYCTSDFRSKCSFVRKSEEFSGADEFVVPVGFGLAHQSEISVEDYFF